MESKDLLIADLTHFGEALWRNEEVGEKRFSFFVTLVTAVISALVALATSSNKPQCENLRSIEGAVLISLLIFGLLTYLRMIQRNHVTDEYKTTLKYIREKIISLYPEAGLASYEVPQRHKTWWSKWLKGGYAETIGAINSILLAAFIYRYLGLDCPIPWAITVSLTLFVLQWYRACLREKGDSKKEVNATN